MPEQSVKESAFHVLLGVAGLAWVGSGLALAAQFLPWTLPFGVTIGTFVSATSTLGLVVITWSYATGQRAMVDETRRARVQAVAPTFGLTVATHPTDLGQYTLNVANFGSGAAHNVAATVQFSPDGDGALEKTAPIVNEGEGFRVGTLGRIEPSMAQEHIEATYEGVEVAVEYTDQLDVERSTTKRYAFDTLKQDLSAVKPIRDLER